jgi:hypothetical protein
VDVKRVLETIGYYEYMKEQKRIEDSKPIDIEIIEGDLDINPSK